MSDTALKIICSLAGMFGIYILLFVWVAYGQGIFATLGTGTAALKVGGSAIRATLLLLCAWSAWRQPHQAAWFAWGAFFAFVISGAADEVFKHGLFGGFGVLIPTYYRTAAVHAILAVCVWLLALKPSAVQAGG